jgi:hypothetical protein
MSGRIDKMINSVKNAVLDFFSPKASPLPLQLTRVTEKFDSVTRPPFRSAIGDQLKH